MPTTIACCALCKLFFTNVHWELISYKHLHCCSSSWCYPRLSVPSSAPFILIHMAAQGSSGVAPSVRNLFWNTLLLFLYRNTMLLILILVLSSRVARSCCSSLYELHRQLVVIRCCGASQPYVTPAAWKEPNSLFTNKSSFDSADTWWFVASLINRQCWLV